MLNYTFCHCILKKDQYDKLMVCLKGFQIQELTPPKIHYQQYQIKKQMPVAKNQKKYKSQFTYVLLKYDQFYLISLTENPTKGKVPKYIHASPSLIAMFQNQQMLGQKTLKFQFTPTVYKIKWGNYLMTFIKTSYMQVIMLFIEQTSVSTLFSENKFIYQLKQRIKNSFEGILRYTCDENRPAAQETIDLSLREQIKFINTTKQIFRYVNGDGDNKTVQLLFWMLKKIFILEVFKVDFQNLQSSLKNKSR